MLSSLAITFLPRSKCLLISWLQSPFAVVLESPKRKSATVSPSICHKVMGPGAIILTETAFDFNLKCLQVCWKARWSIFYIFELKTRDMGIEFCLSLFEFGGHRSLPVELKLAYMGLFNLRWSWNTIGIGIKWDIAKWSIQICVAIVVREKSNDGMKQWNALLYTQCWWRKSRLN